MSQRAVRSTDADVGTVERRFGHTQLLRVLLVAAAATVVLVAPGEDDSVAHVGAAAGGLLAAAGVGEVVRRLAPRSTRALLPTLLMLDAAFLAVTTQATGGIASAAANLVLVHVVATTLVASYRAGLKIALWHSLLLFATHHAAATQLVPAWRNPSGLDETRLVAFAATLCVLAAATAGFSAVNERELRRRRLELAALGSMASALADSDAPEEVAEHLAAAAAATFGFCRVVVVGIDGDTTRVLAATCPVASSTGRLEGTLERACSTQASQLRRTVEDDSALVALLPGAENVVVTPLVAGASPVGVLVAEHGRRRQAVMERRVLAMIEQFAAHAALALRNAHLLVDLRVLADTDALTGLANRRTFDRRLAEEVARAERTNTSAALVLVDIDHFKAVNDTHGHQAGDRVLGEVARVLRTHVRSFDLVARFGGEEFAVVLCGATLADARVKAERLRTLVARSGTEVPVTVSMGVAAYPTDAVTPAQLVEVADAALYRAKRAGRNRVGVHRRRLVPLLPLRRAA